MKWVEAEMVSLGILRRDLSLNATRQPRAAHHATMASHDSYDSYRPSSASPPRHTTNGHTKRPAPDDVPPPPLTEEAKATIDTLKTTYKKRGHFDALRKDIYQRFTESEAKKTFVISIEKTSDAEISRDPSLLARDKNKAAELIEGIVVHGDAYCDVEKEVDELLAERRAEIESMMKAIMEESGVPLLPEPDTRKEKDQEGEKDKDDVDMSEAISTREDDGKEKEVPAAVERKPEEAPVKRSRFDDTIGLHLKDRANRGRAPTPVGAV